MSPRVIWPAPGLPALLGPGEDALALDVAIDEPGRAALRAWAGHLGLRAAPGAEPVPLRVESVEPTGADGLGPLARPAASAHRAAAFGRVHVRATADIGPRAPRTVAVHDLVREGEVVRARCVASRRPRPGRLTVAFGSDLHVAAVWDRIGGAVDEHAPDLRDAFWHPGDLVGRLVAEANGLADRGDLDLLVLGGDLVDHMFQRPRAQIGALSEAGPEQTNLALLLERLAGCRVPILAIPGNHDYRLYPWRPRVYGLEAVGIPPARARELLERAGEWDRWPVRMSDYDALRTADPDGHTALDRIHSLLAPSTDFVVTVDDLRLVLLSTGRDVLPRWHEVERARQRVFLGSLPTVWHDPDSEGLSDEQVALVGAEAPPAGGGTAIFLHAPLFNPSHPSCRGARVESLLPRVDPGEDDDLKARARFERTLFRSGLRRGVFFRNPGPYLRALAALRGPLVTFSGHVHRTHAIGLDRRGMALRSLGPTAEDRAAGEAVLLGAPAVGQTTTHHGEAPAFLLARFERGELASLERRPLLQFTGER